MKTLITLSCLLMASTAMATSQRTAEKQQAAVAHQQCSKGKLSDAARKRCEYAVRTDRAKSPTRSK